MPPFQDSEGLHQLVMWHPNTKLEQELSQAEIDDVVQLQRFLLSVTAKDVSLLITFREVDAGSTESGMEQQLSFVEQEKRCIGGCTNFLLKFSCYCSLRVFLLK